MKKKSRIMKKLGTLLMECGDTAAHPEGGVRDDIAFAYYLAAACAYRFGGGELTAELDEALDLASLLLKPELGEPTCFVPGDLGTPDEACDGRALFQMAVKFLEALPRPERVEDHIGWAVKDFALPVLPLLRRLAKQWFAVVPPPAVVVLLDRLDLLGWSLAAQAGCRPVVELDGGLALAPDEEVEAQFHEWVEQLGYIGSVNDAELRELLGED